MKNHYLNLLNSLDNEIATINRTIQKIKGQSEPHLLPKGLDKIEHQLQEIRHQIHPPPGRPRVSLPSLSKPPTPLQHPPNDLRQPVKNILKEHRARKSLKNPQNSWGSNWLKQRYNLPVPKASKSRSLGSRSFKKPKFYRMSQAKILPPEYRNDPSCEPPPITENDVEEGMLSLVARGLVPRDVDLTPAFERGTAPLEMKSVSMFDWRGKAPPLPSSEPNLRELEVDLYEEPSEFEIVPLEKIEEVPAIMPPEPSKVRNYEEVLDEYSMHHIMVRKGEILDTPEFESFKRIFSEHWSNIGAALTFAEETFGRHGVHSAILDGKKLVSKVIYELKPITLPDLIACVINIEEVLKKIKAPKNEFECNIGEDLAAVKIQACWRGYKTYMAYNELRSLNVWAVVIERAVRYYLKRVRTKKIIEERANKALEKYKIQQNEFEKNFEDMKAGKRVEIHLLKYDDEIILGNVETKNLEHLSRIFIIKNKQIDVLMVTPIYIIEEVQNFYYTILELDGIKQARNRLKFLYINLSDNLPQILNTSTLLYLSNKTIKKLLEFVSGRPAYFVPSTISNYDIKLSAETEIPIYTGEPSYEPYDTTHSIAFKALEPDEFIDVPRSNVIHSEEEFFDSLAHLVRRNSHINSWMLKMNEMKNNKGLAYIDVDSLESVQAIRSNPGELSRYKTEDIRREISYSIRKIVEIVMPGLFASWGDYLKIFCVKGGVIQAVMNY